ncbi:MAG: hypothetical protein BJ554DRAFT_4397 [Olpidium bornovanus]|uniref:Brix domain-containing protein n=1 Tax=Olpidium bornovanus TaxID=278681 RepID=A0A8H7ZMA3_9FUNG|nr:MAG: hypothetical protein BJ554DRAFT_4397 [Olpidium bornovanus]
MGVFKQQERRQRRLRARDGAREAAGDAGRSAAAARDATTVSAKDAAPVAAKAKCAPAPADKSRRPARAGAAAAANAGAPAAKEHAGGRKRAAEGAPGGGESGRAGKLKKVEATESKRATAPAAAADKVAEKPKHKQKVLLLGSRGISLRHQELIKDLEALLPHSKKGLHSFRGLTFDQNFAALLSHLAPFSNFVFSCLADSKLDTKSNLKLINELAELNNCNGSMFFEARRREDLYLWLAKTPNGPSFKFQVQDGMRPKPLYGKESSDSFFRVMVLHSYFFLSYSPHNKRAKNDRQLPQGDPPYPVVR